MVPRDVDLAQQIADLRNQVNRSYLDILREIGRLSDEIERIQIQIQIDQDLAEAS